MLVALFVCAGIAAALGTSDRMLASAVGRAIARRAERLLGSQSAPVVRFSRAPFLTQLLAGVYREVTLTAAACTFGGIALTSLTIRLSHVRASSRLRALSRLRASPRLRASVWRLFARREPSTSEETSDNSLIAEHVTAAATIPFSVLTARLPPGLGLRRNGTDIGISGWMTLMPVAGTLAVAADGQRISVVPKVMGVKGLVGFEVALPGLPPEVSISALRVTDVGLEVAVTGDNVNLARH